MPMSQQLTISNLYNNKLVERYLAWIRDVTGLSQEATTVAAAAAAITAFLCTTTFTWQYFSSKQPATFANIPTPKGARPFVGHLFAIGRNRAVTFHEWHKELGPIFYFRMGMKKMIVLADPDMTHELLSTMGRLTSDRPDVTLRHDFGEKDNRGIVLGQPHDKSYSVLRKSALNALGPKKLKEASPILCKEADEFVNIVATGENVEPLPNVLRVSLNFVLLTVFNVRATSIQDPLYKEAISIINTSMSFTHFKNTAGQFIPVLKVLDPIMGIKRKTIDYHENIIRPFYLDLIETALNDDGPNMTKDLNEEMNNGRKGYYNNLLSTIHDIILAGTDTTAVTISWGFLQISTKPDVQKKIQQEIDAFVAKNGRIPYFWERDEVPYMIATQRECMRLRPTTEFGVTHATAEEFEWRGSIIPKNTFIMANMTDAHLNPEKYPNPEQFMPERFLGKEETMASSANRKVEHRDQFNFGWGRRVCVGTHLAETQMFNVWVRVLHRCDIKPALDKNGNEVPESLETVPPLSGPVVVSPSPFKLRFVPRNNV
ncbi:cytochrome P450 [Phascolomyces articulosus]|uniref:Cytochrome P450 n=1 Tax=Phascolomyces articulosus TaxID=60185 RepID=A0AAD5P7Y0_9FUNG|nr:cytochrome P450 [Phascolomyces articulosus]